MAWTFPDNQININARISFGAAWNDVDLGANNDVPAGTKAIILDVRHTGTTGSHGLSARYNGSAANRIKQTYYNQRHQLFVVLDANRVFEGYFESNLLDVRIVAYCSDDTFFTAEVDKSTATTGSYVDVDVSANGVPVGATAIWLELAWVNVNYGSIALRKNGISHDVYGPFGDNVGTQILGWAGLDGSRLAEQKISSGNADIFMRGYGTGVNTNALDTPITPALTYSASWQTIDLSGEATIPANAIGVIVQFAVDSGYTRAVNFRKYGSSDALITKIDAQRNQWAVVGLDANRKFQIYGDYSTHVALYVIGYITSDVGATVAIYGEGKSVAQADAPNEMTLSMKGEGSAIAQSDNGAVGAFSIFGEGLSIPQSEAITGKILSILGLGQSQSLSESLGKLIFSVFGEGKAEAKAETLLRKTVDVEILSDPNLIVRFQPYIGGGGVLTYQAGEPDVATFWDIVGVGADGFEEPPHGSLRWHYVKADKAGLAANIYVAPKDPALAGHRDRIIVRKANA